MTAKKRHAGKTAKRCGACALARRVRIVCAANAAMSAGAFALAVAWGLALPATTAFNAEEQQGRRAEA